MAGEQGTIVMHPRLTNKVDEGDADLATFFYYLGLAAAKAAPRKKKPWLLYWNGVGRETDADDPGHRGGGR